RVFVAGVEALEPDLLQPPGIEIEGEPAQAVGLGVDPQVAVARRVEGGDDARVYVVQPLSEPVLVALAGQLVLLVAAGRCGGDLRRDGQLAGGTEDESGDRLVDRLQVRLPREPAEL